jgi:DNA-binding XRE family transcriptional regulator
MLETNVEALTLPVSGAFTKLADVSRNDGNANLFDALKEALEDLEDELAGLAALELRNADKAAGIDLHMPKEQWAEIRAGKSAVTVIRKYRGLTQKDLAEQSGVGQSQISLIESGGRDGSVAAFKAIAKVLKAPLDVLVGE